MRMLQRICLGVLFFLGCQGISAQKTGEKDIKTFLEQSAGAGTFKIDVTMAYPMRGRSVPLTGNYSLELKNDSADVYLPYYGRAYNVPYGGGKGLVFKAPVEDYRSESRKGKYNMVTFSTSNEEDSFDFVIRLYENGRANISVMMRNRSSISYSGMLDATGLQ